MYILKPEIRLYVLTFFLVYHLYFVFLNFQKFGVKHYCKKINLKSLPDTRNFLAHNKNCLLTKDEYDTWLNTVEKATLNLAKVVSSSSLKMIQKQISDFKKDGFPWIDGQHIFIIA
jgi:hypothetical protein